MRLRVGSGYATAEDMIDSVSSSSSQSPLPPVSSTDAIINYRRLHDEIIRIQNGDADLQSLVETAEKLIDVFAPTPQSVYTHRDCSASVRLDAVMNSMLVYAEECGSEGGKRYVAAAIVACSSSHQEKVPEIVALSALGITWLTHLLFIFKTSHRTISQKTPKPAKSTGKKLMARDGYQCALTGYEDVSRPIREKPPAVFLKATHILRRGVGEFCTDPESEFVDSAATTFDILVDFTCLSPAALQNSFSELHDASNGILLESNARLAFDGYHWCLQKTQAENVYSVKVFDNVGHVRRPPDNVTFRDKTDDFDRGANTSRKGIRSIPLPNPSYIAIHASIAGILHMSAAGSFFDELLHKYRDRNDNCPPVQCWPQLEEIMQTRLLRNALSEAFQGDNMC
ncbi:hypothetical protein HYPSUDRAFT_206322 [Hypholoma sublateritium FD-334 SS-4]|uniref:HNH nuclease domain-containing protein n=1 Tax=Hypholoma sublateritium (strain FD-334 SS-4) TaxID=945553 RepID=A0A0D2NL12_HYPSF|nr:hypothetical protein HYPSUDRAFT_206322 [Hypholoma sublateritium FD-334 SS-4]